MRLSKGTVDPAGFGYEKGAWGVVERNKAGRNKLIFG
jgi:hypothetical protein